MIAIAHTRLAFGQDDDCWIRGPLSKIVPELQRGCPELAKPNACTEIDGRLGNAQAKISIRNPGYYCLTEDLHARFEMADHPAERAMIDIRASDVVLDLQGHTLGRGRLFKNPGGVGISIGDQSRGPRKTADSRNIVIRNGVIKDFAYGVTYEGHRYNRPPEVPRYDPRTNTYHFEMSAIVVENVVFKGNERDFEIRAPN